MGLLHVRDVIVGDPLAKGISGGERKRLSVAMELLTSPRLLFLDEPTSGLDSVTALGLVMTLRALAAEPAAPPSNGGGRDNADVNDAPSGDAAAVSPGGAGDHWRSRGHCTVLCTIHQPQSKIFHSFDGLVLLQAGAVVYQGAAAGALDHFAQVGALINTCGTCICTLQGRVLTGLHAVV